MPTRWLRRPGSTGGDLSQLSFPGRTIFIGGFGGLPELRYAAYPFLDLFLMIFMVLAVLLLVALLAGWRGWRWLSRSFAALALLLVLAVGCGPLPMWLLDNLQRPYVPAVSGTWAPRNAIVLLGAGTTRVGGSSAMEPALFAYGRIVQSAMLYRECKASGQQCLLLVSGGDAQHHGEAEAVTYGTVLRRLGVPAEDLLLESRSMSTLQNAQFSRPLLQAYGAQRVLLVSSGIHLRRSLLYFAHFGIMPTPVRGDYAGATLSISPLAGNFMLWDSAVHEYIGIARYRVYNAMGWNAPKMAPLNPAY